MLCLLPLLRRLLEWNWPKYCSFLLFGVSARPNHCERSPIGDFALYCERNLVERFFNQLKHFRAIATRYDKLARNFLAGVPKDKAERWQKIHGPLFRDIWPLDAGLRSEATTRNIVHMVLECEGAFPDAVETVLDLIVPYHLYSLAHSLRLEPRHDQLVSQFPMAFVKLTNAIIDPTQYPVPNDLATLLQECFAANPAVANEPSYIRLFGLRRQRGA